VQNPAVIQPAGSRDPGDGILGFQSKEQVSHVFCPPLLKGNAQEIPSSILIIFPVLEKKPVTFGGGTLNFG
jgi:hypothetical protein